MSGFLWSLTNGDLEQVKDFVENQVCFFSCLFLDTLNIKDAILFFLPVFFLYWFYGLNSLNVI